MTAAQTLAALLLPLIALSDDLDEIRESIEDIYTHDIGGAAVGMLASDLDALLDGEIGEPGVQETLWRVGILSHEDGPATLTSARAALRAVRGAA